MQTCMKRLLDCILLWRASTGASSTCHQSSVNSHRDARRMLIVWTIKYSKISGFGDELSQTWIWSCSFCVRCPIRCALWTLNSPLLSPVSAPSFCSPPELDALRHNRWYSTTDCRSARIWCRSTFVSINLTGTFSVKGVVGHSEDKLDFCSLWILRLEAQFGVKVSYNVFWIAVEISGSVNSKNTLEKRKRRSLEMCFLLYRYSQPKSI